MGSAVTGTVSVARKPDAGAGATLAERIAGFPVISCDIFDTAVMRCLARPTDVLLVAGARLRSRGLIAAAPEAFREYRLEAERFTREAIEKSGDDEVRISDVYARLEACGVVTEPDLAATIEFAAEQAVCRPIETVRATLAARDPGQRLIFLSDSMLPGDWLASLLRGCGYGEDFTVYASSDFRRSKHTGRLFPTLIKALDCAPTDIVHIGDNPLSDVRRARENGLSPVHVPWISPVPESEAVAEAHPIVRLAHSYRRSRATLAKPQRSTPGDPPLSQYFSLLLIGFSLFILAEARRRGARKIFFLARDGHLPLGIVKRIIARTGEDFELIYLHVSRQAILVPSMAGNLAKLADHIRDSMQGKRLDTVLDCIGIDSATAAGMLRESGLDPAQNLTGSTPLHQLFDRHADVIGERLHRTAQPALAYLDQSGFCAPGPRLVVDVGWKGTIQVALTALTGAPAADVTGCYLGLWASSLRPGLDLDNAAGYLFAFGHPKPLMDMVREGYILLELFLSAPHGTVLGYADQDGTMVPVHATEAEPGASVRRRTFADLEAGCVAEFEALDDMLGGHWPEQIDAASALFDLTPLLTHPTRREVAMVNTIPFIHSADGRENVVAVNQVPLKDFVLSPAYVVRRIGNAPWRSGIIRLSLPWPIPSMNYATFCDRMRRLGRYMPRGYKG